MRWYDAEKNWSFTPFQGLLRMPPSVGLFSYFDFTVLFRFIFTGSLRRGSLLLLQWRGSLWSYFDLWYCVFIGFFFMRNAFTFALYVIVIVIVNNTICHRSCNLLFVIQTNWAEQISQERFNHEQLNLTRASIPTAFSSVLDMTLRSHRSCWEKKRLKMLDPRISVSNISAIL